jgi:CRISPR-associated protein Csh1
MVFNGIQDDLKQSNPYGIKDKLNIWFSLYEKFNPNFNPNDKTMASKLKDYRQFMEILAEDKADISATSLEEFAFAAGQVIYYILQKSKSADTSYQRLEPYLQQVSCEGLKKAIANDFARYKHENYSARFERAAAFVLTYQTEANMKKVLPELLAGIFSNNQLFS